MGEERDSNKQTDFSGHGWTLARMKIVMSGYEYKCVCVCSQACIAVLFNGIYDSRVKLNIPCLTFHLI